MDTVITVLVSLFVILVIKKIYEKLIISMISKDLAVANRMAYNNRFQIYIRFARIFTEVLI